jgi:hypothetical protein
MGVITEVTNQSIFGRIGNSIVGMLFGFVLLAGSVSEESAGGRSHGH